MFFFYFSEVVSLFLEQALITKNQLRKKVQTHYFFTSAVTPFDWGGAVWMTETGVDFTTGSLNEYNFGRTADFTEKYDQGGIL